MIYPQRKTSDDISEEAHNLWLIDERLSYCSYIASDIPFDKEKRGQIFCLWIDHLRYLIVVKKECMIL